VRTVWFVDTSVLCNLFPVPGHDQHRASVQNEMRARQRTGDAFILPLTAVIETGNHISKLPDGRVRRRTAEKFCQVLSMVKNGTAPWRLHVFSWNEDFLQSLVDGAATGRSLVDHAMSNVGCGDLCVLAEREIYRERTGLTEVRVWSLDQDLLAYS